MAAPYKSGSCRLPGINHKAITQPTGLVLIDLAGGYFIWKIAIFPKAPLSLPRARWALSVRTICHIPNHDYTHEMSFLLRTISIHFREVGYYWFTSVVKVAKTLGEVIV